MPWTDKRAHYQRLAEMVEPVAVVETKEAWYWAGLWWTAVILTLGGFALALPKKKFMEEYATTLCTRQGFCRLWAVLGERLIFHEGRHTTQSTWFGWLFFPVAWINRRLRAWLGLPLFALVYAALPLPVYLAAGRFYLELDADVAAWRRCLRMGIKTAEQIRGHAKRRAARLSSGAYFWAWPREWAETAYAEAAEREIKRANTAIP